MIKHTLLPAVLVMAATALSGQNTGGNNTTDPIVGTWVVKVPGEHPEDTFYALHTFHQGGTFTEVSTLLPQLLESPAHGTWAREGDGYKLTFILFSYDDEGAFAGYIQVRNSIKLSGDRIDADTIVDVVEPDGNIIPAVAVGPFYGLRQKLGEPGLRADVPPVDQMDPASKSSRSGEAAGGGRRAVSGASAVRRSPRLRTWSGLVKR